MCFISFDHQLFYKWENWASDRLSNSVLYKKQSGDLSLCLLTDTTLCSHSVVVSDNQVKRERTPKRVDRINVGLPRWLNGKESACQCRKPKKQGSSPWVGKVPWSEKWQPTPVFLPGKFHGQRSLVGLQSMGYKELDMTEWLSMHTGRINVMMYAGFFIGNRGSCLNPSTSSSV